MQRLKIVFSGPMGVGKTQAIASLSDIPVVSTEVKNTDLHVNTMAHLGRNALTLFGRFCRKGRWGLLF